MQHIKHNKISHLVNGQGQKLREHNEITNELVNHVQDLMQEPNVAIKEAITHITNDILCLVSQEYIESLLRPIKLQEVEEVVLSMPTRKAPGPDGFTTYFFQHYWSVIKEDV